MRFAAVLLVGLTCVVLVSTGCPCCEPDPPNPPVADGACSNPTGQTDRFVDCGNGTVTDTQTHLIWTKMVSCFPTLPWPAAVESVTHFQAGACSRTLMDHSAAGDWRLPTPLEWEALLKPSCPPLGSTPALPDKSGSGCYADGPWAINPLPEGYWSSDSAYAAYLNTGLVSTIIAADLNTWVVRN